MAKIALNECFSRVDKFIVETIVPGMGSSIVRGGMNVLGGLGLSRKLFAMKNNDLMGMSILDCMVFLDILNPEDGMVDVDQLQKAKELYYSAEPVLDVKGLHFDEKDATRFVDTLRGGPSFMPQQIQPNINPSAANSPHLSELFGGIKNGC